MKWLLSIKTTLLPFIAAMTIITHDGRYVDGAGYQGDQSSKGIDNGDNNSGTANYQFEYGVDDRAVGPQFGHQEERNGQLTRGRYSVLLPDGRLQVVTYRADHNGYKADVTYENGPTPSSGGSEGGYSGGSAGRKQESYEKVETSATSYGPPIPPSQQSNNNNHNKGYSGSSGFQGGSSKSFGKGSSRSFVKLRRTVDGRMFNYAY